jgi:hypothetical protein
MLLFVVGWLKEGLLGGLVLQGLVVQVAIRG